MGRPLVPRYKKVVVIGLDGLEPKLAEPWLAAGLLPNLARIEAMGGRSTVATTSPAQTPVAWSTFATGLNPGGHGIFDFIRRDPKTYLPDLALNRYEQKTAWLPPKAVNSRGGTPVWDRLAAAGIASTILRCPCTYPAALDKGKLLAGMGVPDLRGGLGTPTFYSSDPDVKPRESENVVVLKLDANPIASHIIGPRNPKDRSTLRIEMTLKLDRDAKTMTIQVGSSGKPSVLVVKLGEWSDWIRVKFKLGMLQSVHGMIRFHLVRLDDRVELYASPINFDPEMPLFPISAPSHYVDDLTRSIGLFHTTGMVEDHTGLNNERISEQAFLDQCGEVWNEREAMMLHELKSFQSGLFYCLYDTPDRVQHMYWRFTEPGHPANEGRPFDPKMAEVIQRHYQRADRVVGSALAHVDDQTLLIVLSDHGFNTFRRGFNVNTWLHEQGYLALKDGLKPGEGALHYPSCVDWSKTRAYALGLGGIYLNLEGREGQGIVKPSEAEALAKEIVGALTGLIDAETGEVAVREVKTREELYSGAFAHESPDLVVHLAAGYRISWDSSLGGVPEGLFEYNRKKWGGDHIIDPALVPGILFMNQPFQGQGASLIDLAPTILDALGVEKGLGMEGRSLLS